MSTHTTETVETVRTIDGREVPAAGSWIVDSTHTQAEFVARHLMVSKVRGGFSTITGSIEVADEPTSSIVTIVIEAASVSTGTPDRDAHLRSADFLDVDNHPEIRFVSTSVAPSRSGWTLAGDLTIKDVTRSVTLDFDFLGVATDPWGNEKAAFTAGTEIDREDWGLTWNAALEGGGFLVSKTVKLEIDVQAAFAG
jgi:polyisoprenoid-binding protein YceI